MSISLIQLKAGRFALLLLLLLTLAACNNSEPDINGNTSPAAEQPGSSPRTSLAFASTSESTTPMHATPGESVLSTTLATTSASVQSFDDLQILVLGPMCSGCHTGGGISQPTVFNFSTADASYNTLINKQSIASPTHSLVAPGDSANSYLMHTLEGTQTAGSRMPMRSAPVPEELLNAMRAWIDAGASR